MLDHTSKQAVARQLPFDALLDCISASEHITSPSVIVDTRSGEGEHQVLIDGILSLDDDLSAHFRAQSMVDPSLTRQLVSFQANKDRNGYRWFKYKEAFSASLVHHLLGQYSVPSGRLLDPFAGSGTALFAASHMGIEADGIELLPIGLEIIDTRVLVERGVSGEVLSRLNYWLTQRPWEESPYRIPLPQLRITRGAYPTETADALERYLGTLQEESPSVQRLLRFALLCVLESISYTRKDGQYLRWDYRSGRRQGSKIFDKGSIVSLGHAISNKIEQIVVDVQHSPLDSVAKANAGGIRLIAGSCLKVLPSLGDSCYDVIVTSPPYCNRYDYTRTYALELALLGITEQGLLSLRQAMLSCTVENRPKDFVKQAERWTNPLLVADNQPLLQAILRYLGHLREDKLINNMGIPRMVRGYFYEMACTIAECSRVLKSGGMMIMVNDNVRYAGVSVPVDLILSDIAERLGFLVERILVLPGGKGNSSQQMGEYGRESLRKCVYVWRKS